MSLAQPLLHQYGQSLRSVLYISAVTSASMVFDFLRLEPGSQKNAIIITSLVPRLFNVHVPERRNLGPRLHNYSIIVYVTLIRLVPSLRIGGRGRDYDHVTFGILVLGMA